MKRVRSLVCWILVGGCTCWGADEMPMRFRADPAATIAAATTMTPQRFPDADLIYLEDRFHTRYEADGAWVTWEDEWVKVFTEKGRRAMATLSVDFSARYGDAEIQCVEVVGTNGQMRVIDFAQTLKTATDNSSLGSNIADPLDKVTTCSVPGLAVGEIRHVRIRRREFKGRMKDAWADTTSLEHPSPTLCSIVSVDQPKERPLRHALVRNPKGSTVTRSPDEVLPDGRILSQWAARDVPQYFPEPNMPPRQECTQTLLLSTIDSWKDVSRWYWALCEPHMRKTTPDMTNQVATLIRDCTTEQEKIRAVFKFVSQKVRYMGLTLEDTSPGYEPHDVDITFENLYGVCRDKAALLVALLRIAGLPAYPVLFSYGAKKAPEVALPWFNHAIVCVEMSPGRYELMDPTNENAKELLSPLEADQSFLVCRPEGEDLMTSPVRPVSDNQMTVASEGTMAADGSVLLTTSFDLVGYFDATTRQGLLKKKPEERRRFFEAILAQAAPGAELLSLEVQPTDLRDTETPLAVKTVARLPQLILRGRTRDVLSPLFVTQHWGIDSFLDGLMMLEERRFPLRIPLTIGTTETVRLKLDEAVGALVECPADLVQTNVAGYAFLRTLACTNGVYEGRRVVEVNKLDFDVPSYYALRETRRASEVAERANFQFHVRDEADANIHWLRESQIVHFSTPRSWVETNIVEKKVLTYRGMKDAAEMKFRFAPSVRQIDVVSATVSNANGKVFTVTPKEITVMDCDWAASAARYPASKLLIVNLPGVEVGSVIRVVTAETVTHAPVAFSMNCVFGRRDPVDQEDYEFHVPEGLAFAWREKRVGHTVTNGVWRWSMSPIERLPNEPSQPGGASWRPSFSVSLAEWGNYGRELSSALAAARATGSEEAHRLGAQLTASCETPQERITAVRTFLAHRMRQRGPSLFELPFDQAFSTPDRVLAEAYASVADTRNLLCALLEGAGFACDLVLVADDALATKSTEEKRRAVPRPGALGNLVVRARWRSGWLSWLPFCGTETTYWVAGENEYVPAEASCHLGCSYFDPARNSFGEIPVTETAWVPRNELLCRMTIRENGAVDFDMTNRVYGTRVGSYRKMFDEILPEMKHRFFQKLVGELALNATATSELDVDLKGYPFSFAFSAYAPDYAVFTGDALTISIPDFTTGLFSLRGSQRVSPILVSGTREESVSYEIVFPRGYQTVERLPDELTLRNPLDQKEIWLKQTWKKEIRDGRLVVTVARREARTRAVTLSRDYFPYLKDWNRQVAAQGCRTVIVRREPSPNEKQ